MENTLEIMTGIFRKVFDDPNIVLSTETTADDVEGWDSLSHINLIFAVETGFNIRFKQKEVLSFKNVGDLVKCVESKLA